MSWIKDIEGRTVLECSQDFTDQAHAGELSEHDREAGDRIDNDDIVNKITLISLRSVNNLNYQVKQRLILAAPTVLSWRVSGSIMANCTYLSVQFTNKAAAWFGQEQSLPAATPHWAPASSRTQTWLREWCCSWYLLVVSGKVCCSWQLRLRHKQTKLVPAREPGSIIVSLSPAAPGY